jgi:predicted GIY-YIG superfamily endonuclease
MKRSIVYRGYNDRDELLYVGMTQNFAERMKGHRSEKPWWRIEVARIEQDAPRGRKAAFAAERRQIKLLQPRYNERRVFCDSFATYSLRIESEKFERLREIAVAEHHTVAQKLRVVIERAIADHDEQAAA